MVFIPAVYRTSKLWSDCGGRNLDDERIQPIATQIRRPDEIAAGYVQISLRSLRVVVRAAAGGVQVRHYLADDEDVERTVGVAVRIQREADDLVRHVRRGARVAA